MSLNRESELRQLAKERCRELRSRSTPGERILWEALRDRRLDRLKFYRQHPLFYDYLGRESFYIADFYCHQARLVIEVDGTIHQFKRRNDKLRTSIIEAMGIHVLRVEEDAVVSNREMVFAWPKEHMPHTSPSLPKRRGIS